MEPIFQWIESHSVTVDALKWSALLLVAWLSGFFRFIKNLIRKPKIKIISEASRCSLEHFEEFNGDKNVVRAAYVLDVTVTNPTNEKVVIESFFMTYPRRKFWRKKSRPLHPTPMPSRPRQDIGGKTKLSKVFFSNFEDGFDSLTMSGELEPKGFQNGYLMFVTFTHGSWNPDEQNDHVSISVSAELTSGDRVSDTKQIRVNKDLKFFESFVPGFIERVSHGSAWNAEKVS